MLTVFHNGTLVNNETASNDISVYSSCLMSSLGIILIRSAASKVSFSDYLFCILWTTDFTVYKHAIRLERISKKIEKCKLDINFLCHAVMLTSFPILPTSAKWNRWIKEVTLSFAESCKKRTLQTIAGVTKSSQKRFHLDETEMYNL